MSTPQRGAASAPCQQAQDHPTGPAAGSSLSPWEALPDAIPSSRSSCGKSCPSAELVWLSRMSPGHLAPSPTAITSYLFNKIKTCLVGPTGGRGDKSALHAAAREGQPGAGLEATSAVTGGCGPSLPSAYWQVTPGDQASAGSSTASAPGCSRQVLQGFSLVFFPAWPLVAGSWLWPGKDSERKARTGVSMLWRDSREPWAVRSLCVQTGMAAPPRGPPQPRGHCRGTMEAALCLLGDARDKCVETTLSTSTRQCPATRHRSQPRGAAELPSAPSRPLLSPAGPPFPCCSLQDWAPLSWVRNSLQIKEEMRWVWDCLRNCSETALVFPKVILVLTPVPQHRTPSETQPANRHNPKQLSCLQECPMLGQRLSVGERAKSRSSTARATSSGHKGRGAPALHPWNDPAGAQHLQGPPWTVSHPAQPWVLPTDPWHNPDPVASNAANMMQGRRAGTG